MPPARPGGPELRGVPVLEQRVVRRLAAVPHSVEVARAVARVACRSWGEPDACDAAALVTTELVGNSVRHAHCREVVLQLTRTPRRLRLEVADDDPALPRPAGPGLLEEGGRGLLVVSRLATRWGVAPDVDGTGKAVWVELALPAEPW